jgi:hypothetical protein
LSVARSSGTLKVGRSAHVSIPVDLSSVSFVPPDASGGLLLRFGVLAIYVFGLGGALALLLWKAWSLRSGTLREARDLRARGVLEPGPSCVVAGRVAAGGEAAAALSCEITQQVANRRTRGGGFVHAWNEVSRRTLALPFRLETPDGEQVYVVPDDDVLFAADLSTAYPPDRPFQRLRAAALRPADACFVRGELSLGNFAGAPGSYREGTGWILRPPPGGRMLVATEAIRGRYTRRIVFLGWTGALLAALFVACNAVVTLPLALASAFGRCETAEVTRESTYVTKNKSHVYTHYVLEVRTPDGLTVSSEVPACTYFAVRRARERGDRATAPVLRVGRGQFGSYLGTVPWARVAWVWGGVFVGAWLAFVLRRGYLSARPWYDRAVLNDRGGRGEWRGPPAPGSDR